jgi:phosphoribosylaminoimidazolecarboxamide formyltransferase/IMP cyclohydrolase
MIKVQRALLSVSDKKGILAFARGLHALGVEILSTGGTARQLQGAGVLVREVSDYTGFPEILDGRVKTLHPKIHGGLAALRESKEHIEEIQKHGIGLIDMVVVNLYPFESVIQKKHVILEEAIENIDIGGPALLRCAAKNFESVAVICNPGRYQDILRELDTNHGLLSDAILFHLAVEAFEHTAAYDRLISRFLRQRLTAEDFSGLPQELIFRFSKIRNLRYGENPHQAAAFYRDSEGCYGLAGLKQLHGKELSFNNILDLQAAVEFVKEFEQPAAVIIKHNNPTGVAEGETLSKAYQCALRCDPVSAFGGIIGFNRKVDGVTAGLILKSGFMECVIAPGFHARSLKMLSRKKNLRLIELPWDHFKAGPTGRQEEGLDFKQVTGGLLLQEKDRREIRQGELKIVTRKKPTRCQMESLVFGWKVVKNVKSNAIVLVKGRRTIGLGCGQTSRIQAVKIAVGNAGKSVKGAVMASDAFLPKTDNVEVAAKAGIKAIIQTGGSVADGDVIKAAEKRGVAMVMTGARHFKH